MEGADRVQFLHNIIVPEGFDYANYVISYFDQFMAIYVHVTPGNYTMKLNRIEDNMMVFDISCASREVADRITERLSAQEVINLYHRQFVFGYNINQLPENTVQLSIRTTQ